MEGGICWKGRWSRRRLCTLPIEFRSGRTLRLSFNLYYLENLVHDHCETLFQIFKVEICFNRLL